MNLSIFENETALITFEYAFVDLDKGMQRIQFRIDAAFLDSAEGLVFIFDHCREYSRNNYGEDFDEYSWSLVLVERENLEVVNVKTSWRSVLKRGHGIKAQGTA